MQYIAPEGVFITKITSEDELIMHARKRNFTFLSALEVRCI